MRFFKRRPDFVVDKKAMLLLLLLQTIRKPKKGIGPTLRRGVVVGVVCTVDIIVQHLLSAPQASQKMGRLHCPRKCVTAAARSEGPQKVKVSAGARWTSQRAKKVLSA